MRDRGHQVGVLLHHLRVERRQDRSATAQVFVFLAEHERPIANERLDCVRALPRVEHIRGCCERHLDIAQIGEKYKGRTAGRAKRKMAAVTAVASLQIFKRRRP